MVLGRVLGGLFGKGGGSDGGDKGIYYYVKCAKCGEKIRVRVDPSNDLAQEFDDGGDNPSGYSATKGVIGKQCFRTLSVTVKFDRSSASSRAAIGRT